MVDETTSIRADKILVEDASKIAEEKKISLRAYVDAALKEANENHAYSSEKLIESVEKSISLSIYKDQIKKEFDDAPVGVRKRVIDEIKNRQVNFFYLTLLDDADKFKKILGAGFEHILLILKIREAEIDDKSDKPPKEFDELSGLLSSIEPDPDPEKIDIIVKQNCDIPPGKFEAVLFVTLKKENTTKEEGIKN
jgi:hypothetical protein